MTDSFEKEAEGLDLEKLPRDSAEGWYKFDTVGGGIAGEIVDMFYIPEKNGMNAQRGFTLKRPDGSTWNVGVKYNDFMKSRTDMLEVGDTAGFKFEKEIPSKVSGHSPAKSITVMKKLKEERTGQTASILASPTGSVIKSEADEQFDALESSGDEIKADDVDF